MRGTPTAIGLAGFLLLGLAETAWPQDSAQPVPPATDVPAAAEPKPKPRPKPRPKPKPKPAPKAEVPAAPKPEAEPGPVGAEPIKPDPPSGDALKPAPSQGRFAAPTIACDPGKAVLYDGPKDISLWVTRTGNVTIDNPLRPLTPDVTRVLQLVIADKLATAYGRDLNAVRRGASPGALEAQLGGPIRWDATLGVLPDTLNIVADSGASLAEMRFKACGDAPPVKAAPVAKAKTPKSDKPKPARKAPAPAQAGAPAPPSDGGASPRQFNLPQGAIPQ